MSSVQAFAPARGPAAGRLSAAASARSSARDCVRSAAPRADFSRSDGRVSLQAKEHLGTSLRLAAARAPVRAARTVTRAAAAQGDDVPSLNSITAYPFVNTEGLILPRKAKGTAASIFAVLDEKKEVQYVGFSKDIRNTLRTMMGRQPKLCHFFKTVDLPTVDQKKMIATRSAWFNELGAAPKGNKPPMSKYWEEAVDGGATSDRGKEQAARHQLKFLMADIKKRGVEEDFVPDEELLMEGKVDFLPAAEMSDDDLEALYLRAEEAERRTRAISMDVMGKKQEFTIYYKGSHETKGGMMFDVKVMAEEVETSHRVVVGHDYYGDDPKVAELLVERTFAILFYKKCPLHTEGTLKNQWLCVNYFSLSNVSQFYEDYDKLLEPPLTGKSHCWQFKRTHAYGLKVHDTDEELTYLRGEDSAVLAGEA